MCGICGIYNYGTDRPVDREVLGRMASVITHRGPDDEGFHTSRDGRLGLGFRRLAIVDLSMAGHQPMANEDGSAHIVFNGEIYNHASLRPDLEARGHVYRSRCDTETILHQWEESGADVVTKLTGMFAIAIFDEPRGRLFLARDRIGIKPLYYFDNGRTFLFASEIKSLFEHPDVPRRLNRARLGEYLAGLAVAPPETLFDGIRKLRAGHTMTVENRTGLTPARRYWNPLDATREPEITDPKVASALVLEKLQAAVRARLMSDVPFGAFLSGGIDSSAIVALMSRELNRPVETFSIGYKDDPEFNELGHARSVATRFQTNHHEILIDHDDFRKFIPKLVYHQDEPISDPVCVPLHFVAKLARDSGVIVTLVGEGSDELFFGYTWHNRIRRMYESYWRPLSRLPGPIKAGAAAALATLVDPPRQDFLRRFGAGGEPFLGGAVTFYPTEQADLLDPDLFAAMDSPIGSVEALYAEADGILAPDDFTRRSTYLELMYRLPELLLMRVDKMTMATSVEGRVPFLDHSVIELAFRLSADLKVRDGSGKWILKEALKDVLPASIINRPKLGFHVPVTSWFGKSLSEYAREVLLDSDSEAAKLFRRPAIEKLLQAQSRGGVNYGMRIWALVNFALWHRLWIERKSL
jgi:asparagine synthase (glutamine-hydrolysing)